MASSQSNEQNERLDPFTQLMFGPSMAPPSPQPQSQQPDNQEKQSSNKNNQFDLDKIMNGADQLFKVIDKTGPMLKQISPLLNLFKK
ncbi:YppG-like protein [Scopulibacillus darangshiensis]|uniref:YppG-like protein n=1 Tax=Scopulibacillus darangshiensis TaxID=442528 RepID=A0A4R2P6Z5_9BACL|nr:YppG family protein [Scopulibacillus darangshiensis]TCP29761.1 YppG-like protein [Scopulibacillus darangshiensis]